MKIFQQSQDRENLQHIEEQGFIETCKEQFTERSLAATNAAKVKTLSALSYLPNVLSAVTAVFFVIYLLSGYTRGVALILGALLLLIVITVEIGKRALITTSAKDRYTIGKVAPLAIAALLLLFGASMSASYLGGKALVIETAAPPPRPHNPQIDSLTTLLAAELATIDRLQRTTWKGKVTSDAVKGINASKKVQGALVDRITVLEAQDDAAHQEAIGKHTAKHLNFGIILGVLAALADIFLLGMLWAKWHLQYQVAAVHTGARKGQNVVFQAPQGQRDISHLNRVEVPAERPKIGFTADRNDTGNENRYTKIVNENRITEGNRICEHCGIAYTYKHKKQRYCSEVCRIAAWEARTGKTLNRSKQ